MPKIVDHDARRIEILEGCFILFAEHGYAKLSIRQLASSLSVTTGTLYHYFSSKKQIFEALFFLLQERDIQRVTSQFSEHVSLHDRLSILKEFLLSDVDRLSNILKISIEYQRVQISEEGQIIMKKQVDGYRKALSENLELPNLVTDTLFSLIIGVLVQHNFDPKTDIRGQLDLGVNLVVQLLK